MRVEKQIRDRAKDEGREGDIAAREFADEVFAALDAMAEHIPFDGKAASDAERLATVLTFLRTLVLEYTRQVRNHPEMLLDVEKERLRVAIEAFIMLRDISHKRRHPIHKFFRGAGHHLRSRQATSREKGRDCILFAAVGALVEAGAQQEMRPVAAIRLLKSYPGIGEHMPTEEAFAKALSRKEIDPEYVDDIADCRAMMGWSGDASTAGILAWTQMAIGSREGPLDRGAATTIKQLGVVRHASDGGAPVLMKARPPAPLPLPSRSPVAAGPITALLGAKRSQS